MAIGLSDIKKKHRTKNTTTTEMPVNPTPLDEVVQEAAMVSNTKANVANQRPWINEEDMGIVTRTVRAQEAVQKAQGIVEKNEQMALYFRQRSELHLLTTDQNQIQNQDQVLLKRPYNSKILQLFKRFFLED